MTLVLTRRILIMTHVFGESVAKLHFARSSVYTEARTENTLIG